MLTPKEQLKNILEYNLINKTLYFVKINFNTNEKNTYTNPNSY